MARKSSITKEMIFEAARDSTSQVEMAKKFNCVKSTIGRIINKHNIKNEIQEILKNNFLIAPTKSKYTLQNIFNEDTEESFYLAGFLAADGCVTKNRLSIDLSEIDANHLNKICDILKSNHPIIHSIRHYKRPNQIYAKDYKSCKCEICSVSLVNSLKRFNIIPNKSLVYTIPENLIENLLIRHFIRGYIDGDGCWYQEFKKYGKIAPSLSLVGTQDLLNKIHYILNKNCNLNSDNKKLSKSGNVYILKYGGTNITNKIIDYLYKDATIYMDRKKEITDQIKILLTYNTKKKPLTVQDLFNAAKLSTTQEEMSKILDRHNSSISIHLKKFNIYNEIRLVLAQNKLKAEVENISGANNNE